MWVSFGLFYWMDHLIGSDRTDDNKVVIKGSARRRRRRYVEELFQSFLQSAPSSPCSADWRSDVFEGWTTNWLAVNPLYSLSLCTSISLTTSHVDVVCVLEAIVVVARRCRFSTTKSCFTDCEISVNEISCKFSVSGRRYRHPSEKNIFFNSFCSPLVFEVDFCCVLLCREV